MLSVLKAAPAAALFLSAVVFLLVSPLNQIARRLLL